jgi:hypothetical protein
LTQAGFSLLSSKAKSFEVTSTPGGALEVDHPCKICPEIMSDFAKLTGLSPSVEAPQRYLWTDAFAVCNYLELHAKTEEEKYKHLALRLVDQVHSTLGRHRTDDPRRGWISGLTEEEGRRHPTAGGLRIGKTMRERNPGEPYDEHLEWDRDGQYYHYLTKWMQALDLVSRFTGDPVYIRWAIELAKTAHDRFTFVSAGRKRMYWKMSIDLSYPLVPSMGQHDPLDGFITYTQIQATAKKYADSPSPDLYGEIADMKEMCKERSWATDDPLGIGGLLSDAYRLQHLIVHEGVEQTGLVEELLDFSLAGLEAYQGSGSLRHPARYRLAFRELGLAIGLHAVERLRNLTGNSPARKALMSYVPLAETIESFWLEAENRHADSWTEHREINMVMLATSLAPDGYLSL